MKKIGLIFALFIGIVVTGQACDFEFTTKDNLKNCKPGDEIVINVKLTLIHRNCVIAAKDTKFKYDGLQVLSATEWKQESPGVFSRQIKVKILDDKKDKIKLTATRTCDKEGGYGVFTLDKVLK
jgi:hypothetical protein